MWLHSREARWLEMVTPPIDSMAQAEMKFQAKQEVAQSWTCECGFPLANNDFSKSVYEYVETIDAETSTGNTTPIDLWRVILSCNSCGKDNTVDPDDFHLLAQKNAIFVLNAPSPAATASLEIGKYIARHIYPA